MTSIQSRLDKQKAFRQYQYAERLVYAENRKLQMAGFKHFAGIYGKSWANQIWALCKIIDEDRKR